MSISVLPVGGKYDDGTDVSVKGLKVQSDGSVVATATATATKEWRNEVIKILEITDPAATTHACDVIDLSNAGAVSLRVNNGLNVPVQLVFYTDYYNHNYYMKDSTCTYLTKTIPAGQKFVMITPDDMPVMQWLAKLKIGAKITGDDITGDLTIWAVVKG